MRTEGLWDQTPTKEEVRKRKCHTQDFLEYLEKIKHNIVAMPLQKLSNREKQFLDKLPIKNN